LPSATIAYLLLVPELELTLEDVPQLWRRQLRDVLELPRVPVCAASPSSDGLRPCSGGGRAAQLSEATIKFNETDRTKPSTTVYLLQLTKLDDDVVPTLLHEEPRVPVCAPAAPSRDGTASAPCQGGEPLCRSACDPLG